MSDGFSVSLLLPERSRALFEGLCALYEIPVLAPSAAAFVLQAEDKEDVIKVSWPQDPHGLTLPIRPTLAQWHSFVLTMRQNLNVDEDTLAFLGVSPAMQHLRHCIEQAAPTSVSVLITGSSGTGKEVLAQTLHQRSNRAQGPFVAVNCGAIPSDLLESELFGHEKGAFTGAISQRKGRFEMAQGGTLFLDEIGDMPLMMQVKLLRVLQERRFERIGSNKSLHADVRIIAATHRNLEEAIAQGRFREDLYYRLNVFPLHLPDLKERMEDLPDLIEVILKEHAHHHGARIHLSDSCLLAFKRYDWPGNIRELKNVLERLVVMKPHQTIHLADLPLKYQPQSMPGVATVAQEDTRSFDDHVHWQNQKAFDLKEYLAQIERSCIQQALQASGGVVAQAAERLHLRRTTLVEKMRKYDIERL